MAGEKKKQVVQVQAHPDLTEVKVHLGRLEERLVGMSDKQEDIAKNIASIATKFDAHALLDEQYKADLDKHKALYKNDKKWVAGIFGVLYGILIAWIEYRH
jgi:hypothetical protein